MRGHIRDTELMRDSELGRGVFAHHHGLGLPYFKNEVHRKHYVVSIPGPPCPWLSPEATVDFWGPRLSGFPLLPAWWRWRLRAAFSEYTQRSMWRVQAGEDSSSAVSTPKPSLSRGRVAT